MKSKLKIGVSVFLWVAVLISIPSMTFAAPSASILYYETYNAGDGLWQYDYIFNNTSTTGEYLFGVTLNLGNVQSITVQQSPSGWTVQSGLNFNDTIWRWPVTTYSFVDTFSNDVLYDVAAGGSLSGLRFATNYQAGNVPYAADFYQGSNFYTTSGAAAVAPEPVSSMLFLAGGALFGGKRLLKRRKES